MSARSPWTHRQAESDVAEHRGTVLLALNNRDTVTADEMAASHPELPAARWDAVLFAMSQVGPPRTNAAGRDIPPARLLHRPWAGQERLLRARYALAPAGWQALRRKVGSDRRAA